MTTVLTISEFLMNPTTFIDKCIAYEEITKIKTGKGTAVLITEEQYNALLEALIRTKHRNEE